MELKDMILSTLAELEDVQDDVEVKQKIEEPKVIKEEEPVEPKEEVFEEVKTLDDERHFCESMRERILVLFEGFQSPNNKSIEAKVDLTLNFLEYSLAVLDERLEKLDNR
jgi:hypothetical protein